MMSWKPLIARTVVIAAIVSVFIGGAVFVGMRLAGADPGGPASPNELTYSGVLRNRAGTAPLSGDVTLSFTLRRFDGAACPPVTVSAVASADGAFSAPVSTRLCPNGFFNGNTIHYDVSLILPSTEAGQLTPDGGVAITPVPYARFADQVGVNNDCPTGYERLVDAVQGFPQDSDRRLCIKQDPRAAPWGNPYDQVVRVGTGATAFWIDRYESSVWSDPNGANDRMLPHFTVSSSDYPPEFPPNGQWSRRLYAFSRYNWNPARYITWFQAHEACRASGKRLPTGNEWIAAARNTPDIADAGVGSCVVSGSPFGVNERANCVSSWGAQDMIGNYWEWTADWYAGAVESNTVLTDIAVDFRDAGVDVSRLGTRNPVDEWPGAALYHNDGVFNVSGGVEVSSGSRRSGVPSAELRGGSHQSLSFGGVFAFNIGAAPSLSQNDVGFRCVIPR